MKIIINEKRPELRLLKKPSFWLFTLCAIIVSVAEAIDGNYITAIWCLIATGFHAGALIFEMYADDLEALSYDLANDLDTMTGVLKEKEAEIIELKMEKGLLTPKDVVREREAIAEEATQWLHRNLQDKRIRGVPAWQIIEEFEAHMDNYLHGTRKQ